MLGVNPGLIPPGIMQLENDLARKYAPDNVISKLRGAHFRGVFDERRT